MTQSFRSGRLAVTCSSLLLLAACGSDKTTAQTKAAAAVDSTHSTTAMPTTASFGKTIEGTEVQLFTLSNAQGVKATITNYGGTLTSLLVPDKTGKLGDVILGFDNVNGYQSAEFRQSNPYFGALIGRYGNRIKGGKFTLDGKTYTLATNNGPNTLHGGNKGFNQMIWQAEPGTSADGQNLKLTYVSKDGEEGFPGNLKTSVIYTLTDGNELRVDYEAEDRKSVV